MLRSTSAKAYILRSAGACLGNAGSIYRLTVPNLLYLAYYTLC